VFFAHACKKGNLPAAKFLFGAFGPANIFDVDNVEGHDTPADVRAKCHPGVKAWFEDTFASNFAAGAATA
jgi:hypothetical protein